MFFSNKAKLIKEEQKRIKAQAIIAANTKELDLCRLRLAQICNTIKDKREVLPLLEEALMCYEVILFNTPLHDLACGATISNNWALRRKSNKIVTLEHSGE